MVSDGCVNVVVTLKLTKLCVNMMYLALKTGPYPGPQPLPHSLFLLPASLSFPLSDYWTLLFNILWEKKTVWSHRSAIAEKFPPFFQPCIQAQSPTAVMLKSIIYTTEDMGRAVFLSGVCVVCAGFDRWTCGFIRRTGLSTVINSLSN